jgi:tetratricopeptide (TPR) repeat protein
VGIYRALVKERVKVFLPDLARSLNNLAVTYLRLGRRREALGASEEAMGIHRTLAKERPEAFLPELAIFTSTRGDALRLLERRDDAINAYSEALRLLRPSFLAMPHAHAERIVTFVRDYVSVAAELSREPDADLLGPIIAKLKEIGVVRAEGKTGSD